VRELTDDRRYRRSLALSADLLPDSKEQNVAMLVVLLDDPTGEFSLSQDLVTSLAQLGVTNAALVRDEQTAGIVLEGWLFDPARSADAAAAAVDAESTVRVLHPVLHLAVSTAKHEGGRDVEKVS